MSSPSRASSQLTLPSAAELALWNNIDPLESGAGDFPPALEDTNLAGRVITWLRMRATTAALPSQLKWVGINAAMVSQRAHVVNEVLPDGTGEPDQTRDAVAPADRGRLGAPACDGERRDGRVDGRSTTCWPPVRKCRCRIPRHPPGAGAAAARPVQGVRRRPRIGRAAVRRRPARRAPAARRGAARRLRLRRRARRQRRRACHQHRSGAAGRHEGRQPGSHLGRRGRGDGRRRARSRSRGICSIAIAWSPRPTSRRSRCARRASRSGASTCSRPTTPELPQHEPGDAPGAVTLMVLPRTDPAAAGCAAARSVFPEHDLRLPRSAAARHHRSDPARAGLQADLDFGRHRRRRRHGGARKCARR